MAMAAKYVGKIAEKWCFAAYFCGGLIKTTGAGTGDTDC